MSQFGSRPYFTQHANTIRCPHCGKTGTIKWGDGPKGGQEIVGIDGDFYERLCRKIPYHIELVCRECGTPQKGGLQP